MKFNYKYVKNFLLIFAKFTKYSLKHPSVKKKFTRNFKKNIKLLQEYFGKIVRKFCVNFRYLIIKKNFKKISKKIGKILI